MDLVLHNQRLLVPIDTPLYRGWAPSSDLRIVGDKPKFEWKGAKIPFRLWAQVVTFLRWTQEKYKEEAMVTFFYNPTLNQWGAWPFPQEPRGMNIKLLPDHPKYAQDRAQFGDGWVQAGSVHHHCTAKAFQSGTDHKDESDRDGVHITLGEMDKPVLDLHIRQVFDGVMGETIALDWIDCPEFLKDCPDYLRWDFHAFAIKAARSTAYPEEWESRVIPWQPGFPNGVHNSPASVAPHTTILTTPSTPSKKKDRARHVGKALALTPWEEKVRDILSESGSRLGVSFDEMHELLRLPPGCLRETDQAIRKELINVLQKSGIQSIYAEDVLEQMLR